MKTLLRIDSSIRHTDSISRSMGDHFVFHWKEKHPAGKIIIRDLLATPIPHLTQVTVQAFFSGNASGNELTLSNELIDEIIDCDEILITCPMYNFQIPSCLKAYFDHVVRVNNTFQYRNGQYIGLLENKKCCVLTTMGGIKRNSNQEEAFETYLRNILGFIGIHDTTIHCVDGTSNQEYLTAVIAEARNKIVNSI